MVRGSAAQTVDGKIRVRAPGFDLVLFLNWCDPEGSSLFHEIWHTYSLQNVVESVTANLLLAGLNKIHSTF